MKSFALRATAVALLLTGIWTGTVLAQAGATTAGAYSLKITPGARADGMGQAFVALPNDATANWWNPAALAGLEGNAVSLMHAGLVPGLADDVYYENGSLAMHLPGWGGVGLSLIYLTYGKTQAMNTGGTPLGEFSSYEFSPQLSIGTDIIKGISAGATLKYVYILLAPDWVLRLLETDTGAGAGAGDSFGADLALLIKVNDLVKFPLPTRIGVNVQNLGPNIVYIEESKSDPIPRNLKAGIAVEVLNTPDFTARVAYDFNQGMELVKRGKDIFHPGETPIHNMGGELAFRNMFFLRGGYIRDTAGEITAPTFGLGFNLDLDQVLGANKKLSFDYASVPQASTLDRVSKFSLSLRF